MLQCSSVPNKKSSKGRHALHVPIPSIQRFLRAGTVSLGIPNLFEMVLTSAGLCSIHISDAIRLGSCLCHEWTLTSLFISFFFFFWMSLCLTFIHSNFLPYMVRVSFPTLPEGNVMMWWCIFPGPALRSSDKPWWPQLSSEGSPDCTSWAVRCSLSLPGALVEVGTTRNIPAQVGNKG